MTSIAGVAGPRFETSLEHRCTAALDAQLLYSRSSPRVIVSDGVAFAIGLFGSLPEDRADRQPFETDRWLFVADVRLDNRDEIVGALGLSRRSSVLSDSAILFEAWLRWEENALDRTVGDFAFAVFDKKRRVLRLARDPTGQRPLFYASSPGTTAFASMPSGLFEIAGCRADIARLSLALAHRGFDDERSFFVGIKRVLPGHVVTFEPDRSVSRRYWWPPLDPFHTEQATMIEQCRDLLDRSVEARLRTVPADAPVATHLSSGLDSSAVTASAARLTNPGRVIAFTAAPIDMGRSFGPFNRPTDESPEAAHTAAALKIKHCVIRDPSPLLDVLTNNSRIFQEPVRNVLNMGWWHAISRESGRVGAPVLLTAELGNASLNAGSIASLAEWIKAGDIRRWLAESRALMTAKGVSWRGVLLGSFEHLVPRAWVVALERLLDKNSSWSEDYGRHENLCAEDPEPSVPKDQARARLWAMTAPDPGALRKGTLGEFDVDQRDPMSDRRLAEFGLRLPPEALLSGGRYSPLARDAIADRVPSHVLEYQSRGFQGGDWPLRLSRAAAGEALESIESSAGAQQLLDFVKLWRVINRWPDVSSSSNSDLVFGRDFTAAIAAGRFVADTERESQRFGRR